MSVETFPLAFRSARFERVIADLADIYDAEWALGLAMPALGYRSSLGDALIVLRNERRRREAYLRGIVWC